MLFHVVIMNKPRFVVTKRSGSCKAPETGVLFISLSSWKADELLWYSVLSKRKCCCCDQVKLMKPFRHSLQPEQMFSISKEGWAHTTKTNQVVRLRFLQNIQRKVFYDLMLMVWSPVPQLFCRFLNIYL